MDGSWDPNTQTQRKLLMFTRSTLFAAAALAVIAGATLAPSSASAFGGSHGVYRHGSVFHHGSFGYRAPYHFGYRFNHGYRFPTWGGYRNWGGYRYSNYRYSNYRYWPRPYWWNRYHRPFGFGGMAPIGGGAALGAGGAAATPASMPASAAAPMQTGSAGCLTKQYAQDGTVIFRDLCTREEGVGQQTPQGPQPR